MSLATTCTACGTVFRVVQDQLKVSEGWVRCGRCTQVFNALEGLFDLDRDTAPGSLSGELGEATTRVKAAPGSSSAPAASPKDSLGAARALAAAPGIERPEDNALRRPPAGASQGSVRGTGVKEAWGDSAFPSEDPDPERQDPSLVERLGSELFPERHGITSAARNSRYTAIEPAGFGAMRHDSELQAESDIPSRPLDSGVSFEESAPLRHETSGAPEFVRHADRLERWNRPRVRLLLSLASLALMATLVLQMAHHWRNGIAARWPDTLPLFAQWCELASCSIEPPRRIDDIALESSSFARIAGVDQFRVSVVLRNRSVMAVAMPWVDLSLTDASGNLLVRKALSPEDFRVAGRVLEPAGEAQLQLILAAGTPLVTGYTVEVFYP